MLSERSFVKSLQHDQRSSIGAGGSGLNSGAMLSPALPLASLSLTPPEVRGLDEAEGNQKRTGECELVDRVEPQLEVKLAETRRLKPGSGGEENALSGENQ